MYLGPSHLAHAFDKLLFDYVFIFLESEKLALRRLRTSLLKAKQNKNQRKITQVTTSLKGLFNLDDKEIENLLSKTSD
jgi:hypothetical protein